MTVVADTASATARAVIGLHRLSLAARFFDAMRHHPVQ
jgi:hypothetical protein